MTWRANLTRLLVICAVVGGAGVRAEDGQWQIFTGPEFSVLMPSHVEAIDNPGLKQRNASAVLPASARAYKARYGQNQYMVMSTAAPFGGTLEMFERGFRKGLCATRGQAVTFEEVEKRRGPQWHGNVLRINSDNKPLGFAMIAENEAGDTFFALLVSGPASREDAETFFSSLKLNDNAIQARKVNGVGYRTGFLIGIALIACLLGALVVSSMVIVVMLVKRKRLEP